MHIEKIINFNHFLGLEKDWDKFNPWGWLDDEWEAT